MTEGSQTKRRGLGRGLGALITDTEGRPDAGSDLAQPFRDGIRSLKLDTIQPNPHQPRTRFQDEALKELAASIREHGIIQPLIVTEHPDQPDAYWLVAGERRWRAARLADLEEVPALVRAATTQQLMEWALVENVQRADLNALEEAAAYQALIDEFGLTQEEVAQRVGKSRSAVANTIRLRQLPLPIQESLVNDLLSAGHARALLSLADETLMLNGHSRVLAQGLNVRQTEALVKTMAASADSFPNAADELENDEVAQDPQVRAHVAFLEERLRTALGTRVSLSRNRDGSGRLVVHFYNDGDLEQIYGLIAGPDEPL